MTDKLLFIAAITAYILFIGKFMRQALVWLQSSVSAVSAYGQPDSGRAAVFVNTLLDILLFRRLFATGKMLWIGSWLLHVSFFFVVLRHLRYFFPSIPECLVFFQPFGVAAGYLLPLSLSLLLILRVMKKKDRYFSRYNMFISSMLLLISLSGVLMRNYFRADLPEVKRFAIGIMSLSPQPVPSDLAFLFHFGLVIVLIPFLPVHLLAAPLVTLEVNIRSGGLKYIIHEK